MTWLLRLGKSIYFIESEKVESLLRLNGTQVNSDTTGAGDIMLNIQSLVKFPIPIVSVELEVYLVSKRQNNHNNEKEIDSKIYTLYGFSQEEIDFIKNVSHS